MKLPRRAVDGVLRLDKPEGLSSNSAVGWAKRLFNAEKAGHTGTLDPFATGLLPICFGEATKFSRFMLDAEKGYRATLRLGARSTTGDTEGDISAGGSIPTDAGTVAQALVSFLGPRTQIPPMHSALKRDGVPMYKLARQGIEIEREPRAITVHALGMVSLAGNELVVDALVSKGTYIRVLAQDIGESLGCGAYLTALRRTSTGGIDVMKAATFEQLEAMSPDQRDELLQAPEQLAAALPAVTLDLAQAWSLQNGQVPHVTERLNDSAEYRVHDTAARFMGIAMAHDDSAGGSRLTVVRMMAPPLGTTETA